MIIEGIGYILLKF